MGEREAEYESDWPRCGSQHCIGIQLPGQKFCLAHVEEGARAAFLAGLQPGSDLDLRGTPISPHLLAALLEALKEYGKPRLGDAEFSWAHFSKDAWFDEAQFNGKAWFSGAQFSGDAEFSRAQFSGLAAFGTAHFSGNAQFSEAQFSIDAWFHEAQFSEYGFAWFHKAQFGGNVWFDGAQFPGQTEFIGAQFSKDARFDRAQFSRGARFDRAQFSRDAIFIGAEFGGHAWFHEAQFSAARVLGPLIVETQLSLRQASFSAPILVEVVTPRLAAFGVTFHESAALRVRFAEIVLDGTSFIKPSTISFAETTFRTESAVLNDHALETGNRVARPRLLSLRLVDVSNLVLGNLDVSACLFQGTHNLEALRIEGPLRFGLTPPPWRVRVGRWWIPIWRPWMRRQALAEEHHFRAQQSSPRAGETAGRLRAPGWNPPAVQKADWVEETTGQQVQSLSQESLAALYRALRKGLEDQGNAPRAADFYYGEMEMRRHSPTSPWTDRFVLWVYWLFSGYGLRASRALVAFALLVPLFAIGFWLWGLSPPPKGQPPIGYPTALLRSFESATSLLRPAPTGLNEFGQLLDAFLRLIGATLLGLALFSLRGRIKR